MTTIRICVLSRNQTVNLMGGGTLTYDHRLYDHYIHIICGTTITEKKNICCLLQSLPTNLMNYLY